MFTGLLIAILLIVTIAGGGIIWAQRRRELPGGRARPALPSGVPGGDRLLERTARDLRTGDVITYDGRDFVVEGVIAYDEEGHRWRAGRLVDGSDECWLVVGLERGGSLTMRYMTGAPDIDVAGMPPEVLVAGEDRYSLDKRGTATAHVQGQTGLAVRAEAGSGSAERCRWWLYDGPGDGTVIVEQWGGEYRVLRGTKIRPDAVELMPGS
ncbi:DUF4178 domain-containing protein [Haliangium sp.]|uniref:DUF4178 domain-containing protein n=1 Tax=Haliangium sp. TaxID=2663208 RepID=UPI003D120E80